MCGRHVRIFVQTRAAIAETTTKEPFCDSQTHTTDILKAQLGVHKGDRLSQLRLQCVAEAQRGTFDTQLGLQPWSCVACTHRTASRSSSSHGHGCCMPASKVRPGGQRWRFTHTGNAVRRIDLPWRFKRGGKRPHGRREARCCKKCVLRRRKLDRRRNTIAMSCCTHV